MEVLLHKVYGRPASRTMTLRAAGPEDAAAFYALQNLSLIHISTIS